MIDTFREGRNKVQLFSVIQPLIQEKLLPAAAAAAARLPVVTRDSVTSPCQSAKAGPPPQGCISAAIGVKTKVNYTAQQVMSVSYRFWCYLTRKQPGQMVVDVSLLTLALISPKLTYEG